MDERPFTGERFMPALRGQVYYEHMHRYAAAGRFCAGKRVLDLACGEGFGSAFLARRAESVIGVDVDEATIVEAGRRYYHSNLQFIRAEADNLPLVDSSFDVITSFETIEHLENHEGMFEEMRRVLAPGGVLIISSSNKRIYTDKLGNRNPFHVRELYFEEFRDLLARYFPHVAIYGQRLITSSILHPLGSERVPHAGWMMGDVRGAEPGLGSLEDPVYFVAVCSYGSLPTEIAGGFIDPGDDLGLPPSRLDVESPGGRRILLACAPKSGSTHTSRVLAQYYDGRIASTILPEIQWEAEQNLTRGYLDFLGRESYVLQLHMKPYPLFTALRQQYGISLLLQWRNLGDMILSLDEHLAEYGVDQPLCYIHDGPGFLALPAERRYDYLIRNALPWYLWFYLAWRKHDQPFGVYERMVADPITFFSSAIREIGDEPDFERLESILADSSEASRRNVGVVGRSTARFSDENKRTLEEIILRNPWRSELSILLWELPWEVPALAAVSPFDGKIVRRKGTPNELYFVSTGKKSRLAHADSWIASRSTLDASSITTITAKDLAALPSTASIN